MVQKRAISGVEGLLVDGNRAAGDGTVCAVVGIKGENISVALVEAAAGLLQVQHPLLRASLESPGAGAGGGRGEGARLIIPSPRAWQQGAAARAEVQLKVELLSQKETPDAVAARRLGESLASGRALWRADVMLATRSTTGSAIIIALHPLLADAFTAGDLGCDLIEAMRTIRTRKGMASQAALDAIFAKARSLPTPKPVEALATPVGPLGTACKLPLLPAKLALGAIKSVCGLLLSPLLGRGGSSGGAGGAVEEGNAPPSPPKNASDLGFSDDEHDEDLEEEEGGPGEGDEEGWWPAPHKQVPAGERVPGAVFSSFSESFAQALDMECKKRGVPVEAVVAAAALKAVADLAGEDTSEAQLTALIGVDVARARGALRDSRPVGFCAASLPMVATISSESDVWSIAKGLEGTVAAPGPARWPAVRRAIKATARRAARAPAPGTRRGLAAREGLGGALQGRIASVGVAYSAPPISTPPSTGNFLHVTRLHAASAVAGEGPWAAVQVTAVPGMGMCISLSYAEPTTTEAVAREVLASVEWYLTNDLKVGRIRN